MCSAKAPKTPPTPSPAPDFSDEQAALAVDVERQNQRRLFAGLSGTIVSGASGVVNPAKTTNSR